MGLAAGAAAGLFGLFWWLGRVGPTGASLRPFQYLPANSVVAAHVDLAGLRDQPLLRRALAGPSGPPLEADYAEFVRGTGFNFERDLDSISLAVSCVGRRCDASQAGVVQAVLEGRFDRPKLETYGRQRRRGSSTHLAHTVDLFDGPSGQPFRLAFLGQGRLAFSNSAAAAPIENMIELWEHRDGGLEKRLRELHVPEHLPAGSQAWLAVDLERVAGSLSVPAGRISPGVSFSMEVLRGSRMVLVAARLGEREVHLRLIAECASGGEAWRAAESLAGLRQLLRALAARQTPPGGGAEMTRLLEGISIGVEKKTAVVRLSLDTAQLERLLRDSAASADR